MKPAFTIVAVFAALASSNLAAQIPADNAALGREDGSIAAEQPSTVPYIFLGVIGASPIGYAGAQFLGSQRDEAAWGYAGIGGGLILGGAITISLTSSPGAQRTQLIGDDYYRGFVEGYESRLRQRRRGAMLVGTVIGIGVGAVWYHYSQRAAGGY